MDAVDYGVITADIGTVSYWGIFDSQTGGNLLWFGSFARGKNVLNGDAITVNAGGYRLQYLVRRRAYV